MIEKHIKRKKKEGIFFPLEIVLLMIDHADQLTIFTCLRVSRTWSYLVQPFWAPELRYFLEAWKTEHDDFADIQVEALVSFAQQEGSVCSILSQLRQEEHRIKKYQDKLTLMKESRATKEGPRIEFYTYDSGPGCVGERSYRLIYSNGGGHSPSLFGSVKRGYQKMICENKIKKAEKQEENLVFEMIDNRF